MTLAIDKSITSTLNSGLWIQSFLALFFPTASRALKALLLGPRRTGKSSTGNTLLGRGRVFDTRGGGASAAAGAVTAGRHLTVVDAQGWGTSEDFVPKEEKIELLRALSLCGTEGPHVVLLVIPLMDFTKSERKAVERRMEIFTSAVWRHTMVLFTFGDLLKEKGCSVQEHIQTGGPALKWLMEKCHYRYHVLDNKAAVNCTQGGLKQEVNRSGRRQEWTWLKKTDKEARGVSTGGELDRRREGEQQQVRELLSKVEDMLEENGGWHFSFHMYQRLEEEWKRREQQLRALLEAQTEVGSARREQKTAETKAEVEPEQQQSLEAEEQEQSRKKELENKEGCVQREINTGEEREEGVEVELMRLSSEEERWDTSSESGREREEEEEREKMRGQLDEENTEVKTGTVTSCWPSGGPRLVLKPIRRLA